MIWDLGSYLRFAFAHRPSPVDVMEGRQLQCEGRDCRRLGGPLDPGRKSKGGVTTSIEKSIFAVTVAQGGCNGA